jgi:outer membrane protein assembly factor BamB
MKFIIQALCVIFLLSSCKEESNPVKQDPPNPFAQKEIDWPSLQKAPWPMYRHDPQLTGRSPYVGPTKGIVSGTIPAGDNMAAVVIGNDSVIYIHSGTTGKTLSSRKYDGTERWSKNFNQVSDTYCSPILTSFDFLYYLNPRTVSAVQYDSVIIWKTNNYPYTPMFTPGIDKTGNIYFVDNNQKTLFALNTDGAELWSLTDPDFNSGLSTISFSPDGNTLYLRGKTLCAIDIVNKTVKWKFISISLVSSPIVDNKGCIYFFSLTDSTNLAGRKLSSLYSLNPDGSVRWKHNGFTSKYSGGLYENELTIDWDGNIYAATDTLFSYTNDGTLRWKYGFDTGERSITGLTCDGVGTVYVLTDKKNVYAVSQSGNLLWKVIVPLEYIFGLTPSIVQGKLFIPTWNTDKKVFIVE